jgi:hypothetical protein
MNLLFDLASSNSQENKNLSTVKTNLIDDSIKNESKETNNTNNTTNKFNFIKKKGNTETQEIKEQLLNNLVDNPRKTKTNLLESFSEGIKSNSNIQSNSQDTTTNIQIKEDTQNTKFSFIKCKKSDLAQSKI